MVSKVYTAKRFFELQSDGKIAKGMNTSKKLRKDSQGYYLNKQNSKGQIYSQRVKSTDLVYSRAEGVTRYSRDRDKTVKNVVHKVEGVKKHNDRPHFSDREAKTGKVYSI